MPVDRSHHANTFRGKFQRILPHYLRNTHRIFLNLLRDIQAVSGASKIKYHFKSLLVYFSPILFSLARQEKSCYNPFVSIG